MNPSESELTYFAYAQPARQSEPRASLPPVPDLLCNRYRIERLLGVGGMGAVFRARDLLREQLGDPAPDVAIKTLSHQCAEYPDAPHLLHGEFVRTLRLRHPHVVRVLHFDIDPGSEHPFIVMELLSGPTLDQLLPRLPSGLPWPDIQAIGGAMLSAVAYCHRLGTLHGDIKPGNILVGDGGTHLFDFGLGRNPEERLPQIDPERFQAWTPRYAAPEIVRGEPLSPAADVYSLGQVLLELCGARRGDKPLGRRPAPMSPRVWRLLKQAIAPRPEARCSAQELYEAWKAPGRPIPFGVLRAWLS